MLSHEQSVVVQTILNLAKNFTEGDPVIDQCILDWFDQNIDNTSALQRIRDSIALLAQVQTCLDLRKEELERREDELMRRGQRLTSPDMLKIQDKINVQSRILQAECEQVGMEFAKLFMTEVPDLN